MNVTLETLGACKKQMRVEIEAGEVKKAFEDTTAEFGKHAKIPGFRPGKAPAELVMQRFASDIEAESKKRLYTEAFQKAVKDNGLEVITDPDVEELQFSRDGECKVMFTVEVAPQFSLPEYRGLPAQRQNTKVSDADVDDALKALAAKKASYSAVARAAALGDFLVVNYEGSCEGKPITDFNPTARGLTSQKDFWLELGKDKFIPGFAEQLIGVEACGRRTVNIDFPADFVLSEVQNKKGAFEIEVLEVKERVLHPMDDEFAK
ncbi:MAG: trigger factor [Verrucomicrobia bacterium]|nr:trigger factor [Verrucomicrobiota bacterium]